MTDKAAESTGEEYEYAHVESDIVYGEIKDIPPPYGCDAIMVIYAPDESFLLQMFSTTPPVMNEENKMAYRRCVGQFHITPKIAQQLVDMLLPHLQRIHGERGGA